MASNFCFYLSNWQIQDQKSLQAIADFGAPVFLGALDIQKCADASLILQIFTSQQLSIVSVDVDDQKSDLKAMVDGPLPEENTHILWLESYEEEQINALLNGLKKTEISPHEIVYFLNEEPKRPQAPSWLQRLMTLDGVDFRPFQNAIAAYPIEFLKQIAKQDLTSPRRLLVRAIKSHYKVNSVSLSLRNSEDQSPQLGWWQDFFWNSYLLFLSVLKGTTDPLRSSLAMAFGVFVAMSPVYGLQTLLIAVGCSLLRLNFAVAFLGAQISLPPIYSLVVPIELIVGAWILDRDLIMHGDWLQIAELHLLSWVVGFLVVGGAVAILFAFFWYLLLIRKQKKVSAL